MALRLVTAIAGERARRPFAFAFFLLLGAAVLVGPALAEDANEAFSATVKVDATADSAAAAREVARIDGQRRALAAVIEHLSGSSETKPPKLDDKAITDMVDSARLRRLAARASRTTPARPLPTVATGRRWCCPYTRTMRALPCGTTPTGGVRPGRSDLRVPDPPV